MAALTVVDGGVLARVVTTYRDVLRAHQEELNRLNVYPVPDGDTGTNMALTLESVCAEVGDAADMPGVCHAIAHGSLMGARGNSGVILSQILRGLTEAFRDAGEADPGDVARGLQAASDAATAAVMHPVEGTILTVARDAAAAAQRIDGTRSLVELLEDVEVAAHESVDRTPELLPVLARAGVVDAGGRGLALLFDAWLHVLDGRELPRPADVSVAAELGASAHAPSSLGHVLDPSSPRYEVMFLLDAPDHAIPGLRNTWDALGDSIVVVGGDGLWNCHVHTDHIGAAIEAGIAVGRPSRIEITDLHEQVDESEADWVASATDEPGSGAAATSGVTGVVAVASGAGITRLLHNLGVAVVLPGGQSMNPSTQEILGAAEQVAAKTVILLPNNKNIVAVAEQAAALADRPVEVVPTQSVVEALAAMVEYDADATATDNSGPMRAAAERVRTGEVTRAVRDATADVGPVAVGDWIGVTRDGIRAVAPTACDAAILLLGDLVSDTDELVTLLFGIDADNRDVERLRAQVNQAHPHVELEVHDGGQPLYPFILGVE
jgi:uncharacterized protein